MSSQAADAKTEARAAELAARHHSWREEARLAALRRQQLVLSTRTDWFHSLRGSLYDADVGSKDARGQD